jgi:hypothetical protein
MTETSPPLESGGLAAARLRAPEGGAVRRIRVTDFHDQAATRALGHVDQLRPIHRRALR